MSTLPPFPCPNPACQKRLRGTVSSVGKSARCHGCGTTFRLEWSTSADGSESLVPTDAELPLPLVPPATTPAAPALALPAAISRFRVTAALGSGAFGLVYRAVDPELEREVAIKVPKPGTLTTPTRVKRFLGDAKAAARLRHPHIVPVYDVGEHAGSWFIASAFVNGRTLAEAVADGLPLRTRVDILRRLADALDYAHREGVIHRDVKPLNVMLDTADQPHLIDFGLAKLGDDREGGGRAVMGTAAYMSPEQAAGRSHDADAKSDQYSLGVTLYELLGGRTPFTGPPSIVQYHVVNTPPPDLRTLDPTLPLDLVLICRRAMAKDPAGRYASCGELADDLRRWLAGETPRVRVLSRRERLVRWVRKDPKLAGAVGLAAAAVLLAAVLGVSFGVTSTRQAQALAAANDDLTRSQEATVSERDRANDNANEAKKNEGDANRALASAHYDRAVGLCEQGEIAQGMNWFVKAIRQAEKAGDADLERAARLSLSAWAFEHNPLVQVAHLPFHPLAIAPLSDAAVVVAGEANGKGAVTRLDPRTGERGPVEWVDSPVSAVVVPPAGGWFATGHHDGTVRVWKADGTPTDVRQRLKDKVKVLALAAHPTRPLLLAGCDDGKARLLTWVEGAGGPTLTLTDREFPHELGFEVYAVAFHPHPDTPLVLTGSGSLPDRSTAVPHLGEARQFRSDTGALHLSPVPHAAAVRGVAYRPDGKQFATATGSMTMGEGRVWYTDSHGPVQGGVFPHIAEVNAVAYDPRGRFLVTAGQDRSVRAWDATTFRPVGQPMRQAKDVRAVVVTGDRVLAVGDEDAVRIWRVSTGPTHSGQASEDGGLILAADRSAEGTVWVSVLGQFQGQRLPFLKRGDGRSPPNRVPWPEGVGYGAVRAITHRGDRVAVSGVTGQKGGFVAIFSADGTPLAVQPPPPKAAVSAVGYSVDATLLAVGCEDGGVGVWSLAERRWRWTPPGETDGHADRVYAAVFHRDGRTVLTCSRDNTAKLWDSSSDTLRLVQSIPLPNVAMSGHFTADGTHFLIGYAGGCRVFQWTGEGAKALADRADLPHQAGIAFVGVDSAGRTAVTGGTDRRVRWWDLQSGKPIGPGWETAGLVRAARFSADDRVFVADTDHRSGGYREFTLPAPAGESLPELKAWVERTTGMRLVDGVLEVVPVDERLPDDNTATGRAVAAWRQAKPQPPALVPVRFEVATPVPATTPPPVAVKPPPPPPKPEPPKPEPPKDVPPKAVTPGVTGTLIQPSGDKVVQLELQHASGDFKLKEVKGKEEKMLLHAKLTPADDDYWVGVATPADTTLSNGGKPIPEKFTFRFKVTADSTVSWFECADWPFLQQKYAGVVNGKYGSK